MTSLGDFLRVHEERKGCKLHIAAKIISTGCYVPDRIVTNDDLSQFPENSIPLIEQKTGVKERRFANDAQCTSDLAIQAAARCIQKIQFDPEYIDSLILSTSSPDRTQPATATRVQQQIGAQKAFAFDINSVCSGGIFALHIAHSLIKAGLCKNILVIAAELYSKHLNPKDFSTFPYFGDGAGAVLLSEGHDNIGIMHTILKTDGSGADLLQVPAGGTMLPYTRIENQNDVYFKMRGKEIYQFAITKGTEIVEELIDGSDIARDQIKFIIAHQANVNIIRELSDRLNIKYDKFFVNLDKYGNTASASIFIGLDELVESGKVGTGDLVVLVAFGGGLSWGATLLKF
jgi:3-oxoacyl-[acyl-carrier-protein] synthase-3